MSNYAELFIPSWKPLVDSVVLLNAAWNDAIISMSSDMNRWYAELGNRAMTPLLFETVDPTWPQSRLPKAIATAMSETDMTDEIDASLTAVEVTIDDGHGVVEETEGSKESPAYEECREIPSVELNAHLAGNAATAILSNPAGAAAAASTDRNAENDIEDVNDDIADDISREIKQEAAQELESLQTQTDLDGNEKK